MRSAMVDKAMDPASLKTYFDAEYVAWLATKLRDVDPAFDQSAFSDTACEGLNDLELKARVEQISRVLGRFLPDDFARAVSLVQQSMGDPGPPPRDEGMGGVEFWPHVTFLSAFGLAEPEPALKAMRVFTQHFSCEFCVRAFLIKHPKLTLTHIRQWSVDPDWRVRRLASEGTRPRLPWGQQLKGFMKDPAILLDLLDGMHADPKLIVRRSVANNLNDIAKDHPDQAVKVAQRWFASGDAGSQWTVKHGLRTLVKQGHSGALAVLGFKGGEGVRVSDLRLSPETPHIGGAAGLSFRLHNSEAEPVKLVVDYALQRTLARGKKGEKVFKLRTLTLKPDEVVDLATTLRFKQLSTRTYYPGEHATRILVNGRVAAEIAFDLEQPET